MIRPSAEPCCVLIAMPTWVGDAAMATPLLEALHESCPQARKDFLIKPYLRGLLDSAPWLGNVFLMSKDQHFWAVRSALARTRYDWGILLSNSLRPAVLMWAAGVRRRIGYVRNGRGPLLTDGLAFPDTKKDTLPFRMIDFYGQIGRVLDLSNPQRPMRLYIDPSDSQRADTLYAQGGVTNTRPVVGLNPGAKYGSSKLWPTRYFAQTADTLVERLRAQIVILAGPGEDALAQEIQRQMRHPAIAFDSFQVSLQMLKAMTQKLDLMITNDTGPRHIATALGVPTVVVFGPTHKTWGDTGAATSIELSVPVDCGPCMKRTCPLGHHACMENLNPDAVISAATTLLDRRRPKPDLVSALPAEPAP